MPDTEVIKATVSVPRTQFDGFVGRIFLRNGRVLRVLDRQVCEPQEYGGAFTWDYFPFETRAACEAAIRARVSQFRAEGR